ncbi:MAG TPA: AraC family transcriptional regulator [Nannocystaceae bacterium]|nr:AraC family transcriptional regulator [Nannocystaceae bacterium]
MLLARETMRRLCRARALLEDEALSIAAIARTVGLSQFHLIRTFDAAFGATPHQYRIVARLEHAKRLLALGEHSVTETCMAVGFASLGSFSDLFARRIGVPPSVWRRRVVQVPGAMPPALVPGCLALMACLPAGALRNSREARAADVVQADAR